MAIPMSFWTNNKLCEEEIEELKKGTIFNVEEIEGLYERFNYLDRSNTGFLTFAELQMVPEFYSNPFSNLFINHLERMNGYEQVSFASYLEFLQVFSSKSSKEERTLFLFNLFDLDKDGKINREDLKKIYRLMNKGEKPVETNKEENKSEIEEVLDFYDKGAKGYLDQADFQQLYDSDALLEKNMILDFSKYTRISGKNSALSREKIKDE